MKKIDYNGIQSEIRQNYTDLKNGDYNVYEFCGYISKKYYQNIDPEWGTIKGLDPYADLTFAMLEINGIELY